MSTIIIVENRELLAHQAANFFIISALKAIRRKDRFTVALAGGTTPKQTYSLLCNSQYSEQIDWKKTHLFWGDERMVSPDHADSNFCMIKQTLIDFISIPPQNVHRIQGELEPRNAAQIYAKELKTFFDSEVPKFDLILLGMGDDGHTASLFPHTSVLEVSDRVVTENFIPKLNAWRITLTAKTINAGNQIVFLVAGIEKAEALSNVLEGQHQPQTYPSQLITPENGELIWLIDQEAASKLRNI
jgi:6-phosphogluconolactonase